jgi:hypothetical protein
MAVQMGLCTRTPLQLALVCLMASGVTAWAKDQSATPVWTVSSDGSEVIDVHARQVWSRCVEGMRWVGKTCVGEPALVTHKEALALASARRKADGLEWRLPRVTDLRHVVGDTAAPPKLYAQLFPAAPTGLYWASTANVDTASREVNQYNYGNIAQGRTGANANRMAFLHGWAVDMDTGQGSGDVPKRNKLPVRLVRAQD